MIPYDESKIWRMHRYPIQVLIDSVKDYNVRLVCFGSSIKGTATWRSDIDIAYLAADKADDHDVFEALSLADWDENYPWFDRDLINIRKMKPDCKLLEEVDKGMLLRDFNKE